MKKWHYIVITLMAVMILGAFTADRWLRPYNLATERAAARAADIPLTPAEFHRRLPTPGQDAAPDWNALTALLTRRPLSETIEESFEIGWPNSSQPEQVDAAPRARPDVTDAIRHITAKRGAYFPHRWSVSETYPYLISMRQAARFVRAQALTLAHQGRFEEAVGIQARGFRIVDHAAMDPLIISSLVSATIDNETLGALDRILQIAGPNRRVALAVRGALEDNPSRRSIAFCLQGNGLIAVSAIRSVQSVEVYRESTTPVPLVYLTPSPPPSTPRLPRRNGLVVRYAAQPGEATYLRRMVPYMRAARLAEPARSARFDYVSLHEPPPRPFAYGDNLAGMMIPVLTKLPDRDRQAAARRAVLLASVNVMAYRADHGRWPKRLTDAVLNPPMDPYTGKSVGYRLKASGFVAFSAGEASGPGEPIAFRYPTPPASVPKGIP